MRPMILTIFLLGCVEPTDTNPDTRPIDAQMCASDIDAGASQGQRGDVCDPLLDECTIGLTCKDYGPVAVCDGAGPIDSEEPCFRTDFCGVNSTCNERPTGDLRCYTVCRISDASRCAADEECRAEPWHRQGYGYCRSIAQSVTD
jgi:hypothetical protein